MNSRLAQAVKRAAAAAAPKQMDVPLDPFEVAAQEFAEAKSPAARATALRSAIELAQLSKDS